MWWSFMRPFFAWAQEVPELATECVIIIHHTDCGAQVRQQISLAPPAGSQHCLCPRTCVCTPRPPIANAHRLVWPIHWQAAVRHERLLLHRMRELLRAWGVAGLLAERAAAAAAWVTPSLLRKAVVRGRVCMHGVLG